MGLNVSQVFASPDSNEPVYGKLRPYEGQRITNRKGIPVDEDQQIIISGIATNFLSERVEFDGVIRPLALPKIVLTYGVELGSPPLRHTNEKGVEPERL
jgi:hypothetical protein